jgi:hypothetical protein
VTIVVDEVRAVTAAPLGEVRRVVVEYPLAALAVDAAVIRAHVGRVDHPGAVLGRVTEGDPLVDVVDVFDWFGARA